MSEITICDRYDSDGKWLIVYYWRDYWDKEYACCRWFWLGPR